MFGSVPRRQRDPASIGPNLEPHPGVRAVERILKDIRDRQEVSEVVVQIDEVIEGEWPFASAVYVTTTAAPEEVHLWAAELRPDEYVGEEDETGPWLGRGKPPGAPDGARGPPRCHALLGLRGYADDRGGRDLLLPHLNGL
jgi:hypothetical protein